MTDTVIHVKLYIMIQQMMKSIFGSGKSESNAVVERDTVEESEDIRKKLKQYAERILKTTTVVETKKRKSRKLLVK